ncbi:KLC4 [Branchiostoma lanceolatum]|uniref:KLC4 protein n=1 Tax=Branchiostoma lanceolatum TaxID=7740 RepID=A0A8K0AFC0_BRALA|nr:KLC4 [Branchiostoma lanceolatum]
MARRIAPKILWEDRENFLSNEPTGQLLNVKNDMYRFPGIAIDLIALCCQTKNASTWGIIDELKKAERITEEDATHLTVLISIAAELRLRTYIANGGQQDSLSPLVKLNYKPEEVRTYIANGGQQDSLSPLAKLNYHSEVQEVSHTTLKSIFYIPDTKALFRYYCTAEPLKKCVIDMSLEMKKGIYGHNTAHPDIARSLSILGSLWSDLGDHRKAINSLELSLNMRKTIYGETTVHPDIATSLCNLGFSWSDLGDQTKAIYYIEQSLRMFRAVYGKKTAHPQIAALLKNLSIIWSKQGDEVKAMEYKERYQSMFMAMYANRTPPK